MRRRVRVTARRGPSIVRGAMIRLLGRATSVHTQKVIWLASEIGLAVERLDVGGPFAGNTEPEYLKLNPNGTVPTMVDGDFVLWESNAIVRYLAQKYGGPPWMPAEPETAALAGQWMDWCTNTVIPPVRALFSFLLRTPPEKRDPSAIIVARRQGTGVFALLDQHLANHAYVAGAAPTIGDIPVGIFAYRWLNMPIARPPMAHLEDWYGRLCERAGYREHVMIPLG